MSEPRTKATILKVGRIVDGQPIGFVFDSSNSNSAVIEITDEKRILYCGYTVDELEKIADGNL